MAWNYQQDYHDLRRTQMESGAPGDHDKPYKFQPFHHIATREQLRVLIGLLRRFLDGDVGGPSDGAVSEPVEDLEDER